MNKKELKYVHDVIDTEGFDYAFVNYSNFPEVKDADFHSLRKAFIKARLRLTNYLGLTDEAGHSEDVS